MKCKAKDFNDIQSENIEVIFITDFVSKLSIFKFSSFIHLANIYDISSTTPVSKFDKSREIRELQS